MSNSDWEARGTPDEARGGLTRREALRRGTLLGIGMVWVTPRVDSFTMASQYAQATSPVPETTIPSEDTTVPSGDTTVPSDSTTVPEVGDSTVDATTPSVDTTEQTIVEPTTVDTGGSGSSPTSQPGGEGRRPDEIEDEVLSGQLPFTGLPLEQLLPLAGGAVATGAAAVRLARERGDREEPEDAE